MDPNIDPPRLTAFALASPEVVLSQSDARAFAQRMFAAMPGVERYMAVFERAGVERRRIAYPISHLLERASPSERHQDYREASLALLEACGREALARAGVEARDLTHVVVVSSTGLSNPTLDVHLAPRLRFSPTIRRVPLWGLGCGGGAQGLSLAADLARSRPDARVLLLLVELCSLTLVPGDLTPGNLVAAALFGDGAAAAVVEAGGRSQRKPGIDLLDSEAARIESSLDVMGWRIADDGWRVVFSPEIPALVRTHAPRATDALLARHQLSFGEIARHVLHPGGPAILDAYEEALGLPRAGTAAARAALADHGNCSSVSIFQTMAHALGEHLERAGDGDAILFSAFGPGFCAEVLLGRVSKP